MNKETVKKRLGQLYQEASGVQAKEDSKYFMGKRGNSDNDSKLKELYSKINRLEKYLYNE